MSWHAIASGFCSPSIEKKPGPNGRRLIYAVALAASDNRQWHTIEEPRGLASPARLMIARFLDRRPRIAGARPFGSAASNCLNGTTSKRMLMGLNSRQAGQRNYGPGTRDCGIDGASGGAGSPADRRCRCPSDRNGRGLPVVGDALVAGDVRRGCCCCCGDCLPGCR
jgi:hypothetical protein